MQNPKQKKKRLWTQNDFDKKNSNFCCVVLYSSHGGESEWPIKYYPPPTSFPTYPSLDEIWLILIIYGYIFVLGIWCQNHVFLATLAGLGTSLLPIPKHFISFPHTFFNLILSPLYYSDRIFKRTAMVPPLMFFTGCTIQLLSV